MSLFYCLEMTGIYKITSPTGKVYIGQSVNIRERLMSYKSMNCKGQSRLYNSLKNHGYDNHKVDIIKICHKDELNFWEEHFISVYRSFNTKHGMNLRSGGGCGHECSDNTRKKISDKLKGRPLSKETREKLRAVHKRRTKEDYQRIAANRPKITDETRKKLSEKSRGRRHSLETRKKMSIVRTGEKRTDETKRKLSEARRNISDETRKKMSIAKKGKKLSPKHVANLAEGHKKKILQYTLDGHFVREHKSTVDAARELGVLRANINAALCGRQKTAYGFIWKKHIER